MRTFSFIPGKGSRKGLFMLGILLFFVPLFSQVPHSFTYQAVVRDEGKLVADREITVRLSLLQGSESGVEVWSESQTLETNHLGIFSMEAGKEVPLTVDWTAGPYFLKVEVDLHDGSGFRQMGVSPLGSVPYALFAAEVADKEDADADPTNEIQDLQLNGNLLSITRNEGATLIDLSPYLDNTDRQTLSLSGHRLSISGGNSVELPDEVEDADADPTNEIQDLKLQGNILTITKNSSATAIDLSPYLDNAGWEKRGEDTVVYHGSVALGTDSPLGSKLTVQGDDVTSEQPLFEVKRKDGQTVFAVYNEGVRIYVSDAEKGSRRSGFAIGGFGMNKGEGPEYLRVTPDSVRIYFKKQENKGFRGGFAIGGYDFSKGGVKDYFFLDNDSTRVYIDQPPTKGPHRSGFAIGGYGVTKGAPERFLDLTPDNYFIGQQSGTRITTGLYNLVMGYQAGSALNEGSYNSILGYQAGFHNTVGYNNVFIGYQAGYSNIGRRPSEGSPNGSSNIMIGSQAGYSNLYGKSNILIGA